MPTVSSTPTWRGVLATSAPAGAALGCAQTAHPREGNVINVPKEAGADLRQSNADETILGSEATVQSIRNRQARRRSGRSFDIGPGHDRRKVESNVTALARSKSGLVRSLPLSRLAPLVFVVDDDVSVRESLELLVRGAGWQLQTFESTREFLCYPRILVPSCLVLDVYLPDFSSLELQKCVALDRPDMPIIFITGSSDVPMTVQAMKGGAIEFLTKPLEDDLWLLAERSG